MIDPAFQVLAKFWDGRIPVDPFQIAKRVGVEVRGSAALALEGLDGKYEQVNGRGVISYAPGSADVRTRFTVAHELGHHVLKHGMSFRDSNKEFTTTNYDPSEVAANRFAASLLMPKAAVDSAVGRGMRVSQMAAQFGVSEVAMEIRLKALGYLRG